MTTRTRRIKLNSANLWFLSLTLTLLAGCAAKPKEKDATHAVFHQTQAEGCLKVPDSEARKIEPNPDGGFDVTVALSIIKPLGCHWPDRSSFRSTQLRPGIMETIGQFDLFLVVVDAHIVKVEDKDALSIDVGDGLKMPGGDWAVDRYRIIQATHVSN